MSLAPCTRCRKTVYPAEKLCLLDKVWHKSCLKCQTCGMSLTVKTYQPHSGLPYCSTHKPMGPELDSEPSTDEAVTTPMPLKQAPEPPESSETQEKSVVSSSAGRYLGIYDYTAADDDEVSFLEGDIIIDASVIDDGWMNGRIERTGDYGMFPSNYVEQV